MTAPTLLTEWARLLIGSLARAGVTDAVLSPGSRSTPFAWAALREPRLRCHTIVDERCAAFFAVGQAKMSGLPSLLVCTSGSAAANYFPAIVEADRSGTPLLVLTADRPFELQAADAPQTIDQIKLYGDSVRGFFELGMPEAIDSALLGVRRVALHATLLSRAPRPGPIHLNGRARAPLEPVVAEGEDARTLAATVTRLLDRAERVSPSLPIPSEEAVRHIARASAQARRGVIVCGPVSPWQAPRPETVAELSLRTGFPILAEATSQMRFGAAAGGEQPARVDGFDALLRSQHFGARLRPDLVLRIGGPPTSTAWRDMLEHAARADGDGAPLQEHVLAPGVWSDPHGDARSVLMCALEPALRLLLRLYADEPPAADAASARADWRRMLGAADRAVAEALGARTSEFDEGIAVRVALESMPRGTVLAVGNSLPVREVDTFSTASGQELTVWSQRGANGIDGLVSGAAGAATTAERPTALLLGDVSALHDAGGLAVARGCAQPLAIVVLDNGGGRIFEQLPLARSGVLSEADWHRWLTPPRVDFGALAAAFGIGYARVADAAGTRAEVAAALSRPGASLVHVVLDGDRTIPAHAELWADVDRRLADAV